MHNQPEILPPPKKENKVLPLLSAEEKHILDVLAKIFVTTVINDNETSHCLHSN